MNGQLSSMSWKCWGHFDIGPFGCRTGIQSHCITLSQCTTTCWITWMAWCGLWPRRRFNGRKTCSSLWSWLGRRFPNTTLKWYQWRPCFWFPHKSLIRSRSCDRLEIGTREWILILRTRHRTLHNTKTPFWSMWRMNTAQNIDMRRSVHSKQYWAAISSPPQRHQGLINHPLIHMICPAMMTNTKRLTMCLKRPPDKATAQPAYLPPPGSIWIRHLKHQKTGDKLIQISMITTPTQWRLAVHFGYWT